MRNPDGPSPYRIYIQINSEGPSIEKHVILGTYKAARDGTVERATYAVRKKLHELFEDIDYLNSTNPKGDPDG